MILAVPLRTTVCDHMKPWDMQYYICDHYKNVFDPLKVTLWPVLSDTTFSAEEIEKHCDGLVIAGSDKNILPMHYGRQIPEGCVVVFADRDKRNFDPGNLVMMKRSEWCCISKNNIEYWDAESLKAAVAYAKLKGLVAEFEKAEKESNRERCKKLAGREANQKNE